MRLFLFGDNPNGREYMLIKPEPYNPFDDQTKPLNPDDIPEYDDDDEE